MPVQTLIEKDCFLAVTLYASKTDDKTLEERITSVLTQFSPQQRWASTITEGDTWENRFQTHVGVIIKNCTVRFCACGDAASHLETDGTITWNLDAIPGCINPTVADIKHVIDNRKRYNEFLLTDCEPIGIFLSHIGDFDGAFTLPNGDTLDAFYCYTSGSGLPYYYLTGEGHLHHMNYNGTRFITGARITVEQLYR